MTFKDRLATIIKNNGPVDIATYMSLSNNNSILRPETDMLGAKGHFTTSPEISSLFGEIIGVWCKIVWDSMAQPTNINIIELGPGSGRLMKDVIQCIRNWPSLYKNCQFSLVEINPHLIKAQNEKLKNENINWFRHINEIPPAPEIIISNEFFDTFPIHQFVFSQSRWLEKVINLTKNGELTLGLSKMAAYKPNQQITKNIEQGATLEVSPSMLDYLRSIALRDLTQKRALLAIDYGYVKNDYANTLQAIYKHKKVDILEHPGQADLSSHVDFKTLKNNLSNAKWCTYHIESQSKFLQTMGIIERFESLYHKDTHHNKKEIETQVERLLSPTKMGELFKVLVASQGFMLPTEIHIHDPSSPIVFQ